MPDYQQRVKSFGLASVDQIKEALNQEGAIILDVRTAEEIAATGSFQYGNRKLVHVSCTPASAEELVQKSGELLPNKDVPIVIHCKSGRRATTAKTALEKEGYKVVLNAGGYDDIQGMDLN